ncbi:telomere stability and silencing-domain-containing protein [Boletus edulis]|uniref:Telomere stability and silencing-domain-containing protein n=1 Tax=Boletus edulis BED1 TaxID=1328754 RepID=A0AAD4BG49_BOLED|nr:telomere stability and silencing-domain-containing protein [Boletus edulis]KAF8134879.1 telomere stability and silencing-domain-containing protein [Boletus edulis]KAF8428858.1 telomere stability and silencing-domain-containing protein [Boletus edulis BED1]
MSTSVLFSTFPPLPTLSLRVPSETCVNSLYDLLCDRYPDLPASDSLYISSYSRSLTPDTRLSELHGDSSDLVSLRIIPRLRGGKGGFGSQLRAAGGRMSSQKTSNNDSCRDLSGRRLSTIKTAKRLVDYMENEEERKKAAAEAKKAKLETLERKIALASRDPESSAGRKHRFDDTEYLEESQEIIDSVRSAVSTGWCPLPSKCGFNERTFGRPAQEEEKGQG